MSNIKIFITGADGYTCQIPRIKEGMLALGHNLSSDSPDIIYANDPSGYDEALLLKKKISKFIFNIKFFRYSLAYKKYPKTNWKIS